MLVGQNLRGKVITLDAELTHPALATQILDQGGHCLMVVQRNQGQLYEELAWYFDTPPLPCDRVVYGAKYGKGHGRLEGRNLNCTDSQLIPIFKQKVSREQKTSNVSALELSNALKNGVAVASIG